MLHLHWLLLIITHQYVIVDRIHSRNGCDCSTSNRTVDKIETKRLYHFITRWFGDEACLPLITFSFWRWLFNMSVFFRSVEYGAMKSEECAFWGQCICHLCVLKSFSTRRLLSLHLPTRERHIEWNRRWIKRETVKLMNRFSSHLHRLGIDFSFGIYSGFD